MRRLERRVSELSGSSSSGPELSGAQNYEVACFWLRVHFKNQEWEEWMTLNRQQSELEKRYQGTQQDLEEWNRIGGRMVEIGHDRVLQRSLRNHDLRTRIWPELAPRVLRFRELTERPREELTSDETKELEALLEWFSELQRQALGEG